MSNGKAIKKMIDATTQRIAFIAPGVTYSDCVRSIRPLADHMSAHARADHSAREILNQVLEASVV